MIDKDTVLCCSMSREAGSFGCWLHNEAYRKLGLNYVYKSFSVDDIAEGIRAARALKIRGIGVSMPYKAEVLNYVDVVSPEAEAIGAANTVVNGGGVMTAYNTDCVAARKVLGRHQGELYILGRGGYAKAVNYARGGQFITRENWDQIERIRNSVVFNCTPVRCSVHDSNTYIDSSVDSTSGKELALLQAAEQFKLYTGRDLPPELYDIIY